MKDKKFGKMSFDILADKISTLKKYFPESLTEGKIDFDKLRTTLGETIESNDERYTLNWAGRTDTFKNIQIPSIGTLVPDKKESVNFDDTKNIFIEGENLEVLKLLQKSYFEKIKCIYIDPPYNTGKDFIYKDNFHESTKSYLEQTGQSKDGITLATNPDTAGRFHSNWLSFMYARLLIARNLLTDDGVIFVSIDDNEVYNLKLIMDEIFGEENFIADIVWMRKRGRDNSAKYLSRTHEYLLFYAKNKNTVNIEKLELDKSTLIQYKNPDNDPRGKWRQLGVWSRGIQGGSEFEFISKSGKKFKKQLWLVSKSTLETLERDKKLIFIGNKIYRKLFLSENQGKIPETLWTDTSNAANAADEIKKLFGIQIFDTPKPIPYIRRMIEMTTKDNDIVLDFFAGSGSTAHALLEDNILNSLNRKFICVQIPEKCPDDSQAHKLGFLTISDICKERIRRAIKQIKQEKSNTKSDLGFKVFKLAKSNYKIWENYDGKDEKVLKEQIKLFESPLIEKYKDEDVIYECIIKEGYDLNSTIEKMNIPSNTIYKVTDGDKSFYICLDKMIQKEIIKETKITANDILVCMDSALDDSQKTNLSKQCDLRDL